MASGENKKIDEADAAGGPLDVLLSRAMLPADADEQSREAFDLSQVRSALAAAAKKPHTTPKRKRISTKRYQPVRQTTWIWGAGAAALLAGSLTGWLLISPRDTAHPVVQTQKKDAPRTPDPTPAPKVENIAKNEPVPTPAPELPGTPADKKEVAITPPAPKTDDSQAVASSQTPVRPIVIDSGHGVAASAVADAKLFIGFNFNCSVTGCQIENSVYSRNGVAYIEKKFAKNASVFGMKDGGIQYCIYDQPAKTVTMFDPASRTYYVLRNRDVAQDMTFRLLGMLAGSKNMDELLAFKQTSGAITTSVVKADKNADFKDELLKVPSGYTEVQPPRQ